MLIDVTESLSALTISDHKRIIPMTAARVTDGELVINGIAARRNRVHIIAFGSRFILNIPRIDERIPSIIEMCKPETARRWEIPSFLNESFVCDERDVLSPVRIAANTP